MAEETQPENNQDAGQSIVQRAFNEQAADGVVGNKVDPRPDEAYTVAGVTADGSGQPPIRNGRTVPEVAEEPGPLPKP